MTVFNPLVPLQWELGAKMILNPEHRKEMCYQPKTEDYEKDKSLKELIGNAL